MAMRDFGGLILSALLLTMPMGNPATADGPNQYLHGVSAMTYIGFIEPNTGHCAIDWQGWNTEIEFVANQSTKLNFLKNSEKTKQAKALYDKATTPGLSNREFHKAMEIADRVNWMPNLEFIITPIELQSDCAATIDAEVLAALKPSTMISTGNSVYNPQIRIWSRSKSLSSPFQSFSSFAIQVSEQIMKGLVNDWATSQEASFAR